jgi:G:T/U-mismatch repair DNA glycosylase
MSAYERQNRETERRCDELMQEIERQDPNVLSSKVPGSRLHQFIHNPITEGIDEG